MPPLSDYVNDIVIYIAGYVERCLKKNFKCLACVLTLENGPVMYGELIIFKSRGGLLHPQLDTYKVHIGYIK